MRKIETSIDINKEASSVWSVFQKIDDYHLWNPFIIKVKGQFELDRSPIIYIKLLSGKIIKGQPTIKSLVSGHSMTAVIEKSILFKGRHYFQIEVIDKNTSRFIQGEEFSGLIPFFFWWAIRPHIFKGFTEMNKALKREVERG